MILMILTQTNQLIHNETCNGKHCMGKTNSNNGCKQNLSEVMSSDTPLFDECSESVEWMNVVSWKLHRKMTNITHSKIQ